MASQRVDAFSASACICEAESTSEACEYIPPACVGEAGFTSEACVYADCPPAYAGGESASEACSSEDQLPSSTSQLLETDPPELDEKSVEEAADHVRSTLIISGYMDGLKSMMERRLSETGWRKKMMAVFREVVQEHGRNTTYEMLFQAVRQLGKDWTPETVKRDVLRKMKLIYEYEMQKE